MKEQKTYQDKEELSKYKKIWYQANKAHKLQENNVISTLENITQRETIEDKIIKEIEGEIKSEKQ